MTATRHTTRSRSRSGGEPYAPRTKPQLSDAEETVVCLKRSSSLGTCVQRNSSLGASARSVTFDASQPSQAKQPQELHPNLMMLKQRREVSAECNKLYLCGGSTADANKRALQVLAAGELAGEPERHGLPAGGKAVPKVLNGALPSRV